MSVIWQGSRIRCNSCWDIQSRRNSSCKEDDSYFTLCGEKKPPLKNSSMCQLSTYSNRKGILSCVIIIVASLFCQLLGRSLARLLLNRLNEHLEQSGLLPESQCEFRKDRGTIDMVFTVRQLQEKCQEQNMDLYMSFVDLTKAYSQSWGSLENYGEVLLSDQVHSSGEAVPRRYAYMGPKWRRVFWSISCDKWCQARLCTSPNSVQHDVLCHAYCCFQDGDNGILLGIALMGSFST